jgi:hypothetical protein
VDERRWWWITPEVVAFFAFVKDVVLFFTGLSLFILETRRTGDPRELFIIAEFGMMGLALGLASDRRKRKERNEKDDDA